MRSEMQILRFYLVGSLTSTYLMAVIPNVLFTIIALFMNRVRFACSVELIFFKLYTNHEHQLIRDWVLKHLWPNQAKWVKLSYTILLYLILCIKLFLHVSNLFEQVKYFNIICCKKKLYWHRVFRFWNLCLFSITISEINLFPGSTCDSICLIRCHLWE